MLQSQRDELYSRPAALEAQGATATRGGPLAWLSTGTLIGLIVLAACQFGLWTRNAGQLAVFWPANALLLGVLLRFPRLDTPAAWAGAVVGHLVSGWLVGDALPKSVLLTMCNFASVLTGYALLARPDSAARRLSGAAGVLQLLAVIGLASVAGGLGGAVIGPIAFDSPPLLSARAWFTSEIVSLVAILPTVLSIPRQRVQHVRRWRDSMPALRRAAPLLALLASLAGTLALGGPGALAFPVPALLWCGLRYGVFPTALLTMLTTIWSLVAISKDWLMMSVPIESSAEMMSVRLGVTLIAVSPLVVASTVAANNALLARLRHMAEHDPLTGTMNRRAFAEHARAALQAAAQAGQPAGLLILDIDHFKAVNDNHGHSAGDLVIAHVANCLRRHLPPGPPLVGRLGGEEFAVLLPNCDEARTRAIAEAVRQTCTGVGVDIDGSRRLGITVSIGACVAAPATERLDELLQAADRALYQAKHAGRNRVVVGQA